MKQFDPGEFYSRQLRMPEIGEKGQLKLLRSKVAVVGLGGLGTFECLLLALAGVGEITVVDDDVVGVENLHRTPLYSLEDVGQPKVSVVKTKLEKLNTHLKVITLRERILEGLLERTLGNIDCIVDGLDNFETRKAVNKYSVERRIPYIYSGVQAFDGNVSVFDPPETACLECIMPDLSCGALDFLPACSALGVIGVSVGTVASVASTECIKLLLGMNSQLRGKLLTIDLRRPDFSLIDIQRRLDCPVCGQKGTSVG